MRDGSRGANGFGGLEVLCQAPVTLMTMMMMMSSEAARGRRRESAAMTDANDGAGAPQRGCWRGRPGSSLRPCWDLRAALGYTACVSGSGCRVQGCFVPVEGPRRDGAGRSSSASLRRGHVGRDVSDRIFFQPNHAAAPINATAIKKAHASPSRMAPTPNSAARTMRTTSSVMPCPVPNRVAAQANTPARPVLAVAPAVL